MKNASLKQLTEAYAALGIGELVLDDSPPNEMDNCGTLMIVMDQDLGKQFFATGATCIAAQYFSDEKGSKAMARADLINDIKAGLEPMSEDTAWACGVTL